MIFIVEGDKRGSGDDLIASFPGDAQKRELRGADQMSARLSAPKGDAEVTPRRDNQERQPVTRLSATKWIWDVRPERTGTVVLTLEVFAHLQLKSKNKTIPDAVVSVLTKRVEIPITVTLWDRTRTYLAEIDPAWKTVGSNYRRHRCSLSLSWAVAKKKRLALTYLDCFAATKRRLRNAGSTEAREERLLWTQA